MSVLRRLALLLGCAAAAANPAPAKEKLEYEGGLYHLHRIGPKDAGKLMLVWLDDAGKPLSDFTALQAHLKKQGKRIGFATNAGIYERGPSPCGLTICEGATQIPLNLKEGEGNFYLKPNGIFYLDQDGKAGVLEANAYARANLKPRLATQSGPMLLSGGRIHPAFTEGSPNKRQRSGVGVRASDGEIIFAVTDREDREKGRVNFHQFARFFAHLGCKDALFLDGDISQMVVAPSADATFTPNTFAAMFYIAE